MGVYSNQLNATYEFQLSFRSFFQEEKDWHVSLKKIIFPKTDTPTFFYLYSLLRVLLKVQGHDLYLLENDIYALEIDHDTLIF